MSGSRTGLLCLLIVLALPSWAGAEDFDRQVPVGLHQRLEIQLERGDVDVISHEASQLRLEARARGVGASGIRFELREESDGLVLRSHSEGWVSWLRSGPRVRVRAWVPRGVTLDVLTSGRIASSHQGMHVAFPARQAPVRPVARAAP